MCIALAGLFVVSLLGLLGLGRAGKEDPWR